MEREISKKMRSTRKKGADKVPSLASLDAGTLAKHAAVNHRRGHFDTQEAAANHFGCSKQLIRYYTKSYEQEVIEAASQPITPERAKQWRIPAIQTTPSTSPQKKRTKGNDDGRGAKPWLSPQQESQIAFAVAQLRAFEIPVSLPTVVEIANNMFELKRDGVPITLGKKWARNWERRQRNLHKLGNRTTYKPLEDQRQRWCSAANLKKHFDAVERRLFDLGLGFYEDGEFVLQRADRFVSFDETSLSDSVNLGQNKSSRKTMTTTAFRDEGKVIAAKENVRCSLIVASTGAGYILAPTFIWSRKLDHDMLEAAKGVRSTLANPDGSFEESRHRDTPSGGNEGYDVTRDFVFKNIKKTMVPTAQNPLVVTFDGVITHISAELFDEMIEHHMHPIMRIPHTTHVCQPEDQFIFGSLKKSLKKSRINTFMHSSTLALGSVSQKICMFLSDVASSWKQISQQAVLASYKVSGYVPFSRSPQKTQERKERTSRGKGKLLVTSKCPVTEQLLQPHRFLSSPTSTLADLEGITSPAPQESVGSCIPKKASSRFKAVDATAFGGDFSCTQGQEFLQKIIKSNQTAEIEQGRREEENQRLVDKFQETCKQRVPTLMQKFHRLKLTNALEKMSKQDMSLMLCSILTAKNGKQYRSGKAYLKHDKDDLIQKVKDVWTSRTGVSLSGAYPNWKEHKEGLLSLAQSTVPRTMHKYKNGKNAEAITKEEWVQCQLVLARPDPEDIQLHKKLFSDLTNKAAGDRAIKKGLQGHWDELVKLFPDWSDAR